MNVEEYRDERDGVLCMKITRDSKKKISCMRDVRDELLSVINLSVVRLGNHTIVYTTDDSKLDHRTYIITYSDISHLVREGSVVVYSYKGDWSKDTKENKG